VLPAQEAKYLNLSAYLKCVKIIGGPGEEVSSLDLLGGETLSPICYPIFPSNSRLFRIDFGNTNIGRDSFYNSLDGSLLLHRRL